MNVRPGDEFFAVLLRVRDRSLDVIDMTSDRPAILAVAKAIADAYREPDAEQPTSGVMRLSTLEGGAHPAKSAPKRHECTATDRPPLRLVGGDEEP